MSTDETISSYNRIADEFAERWQDRRNLMTALARFVALVPDSALVLDVGCGPGYDAAALRKQGLRAIGLDLSWGMLQTGSSRYPGPYVQADMRRLPVKSGVDAIWCSAALLHLAAEDALVALKDFRRVLRPGGVLYLSLKEGQGASWREEAYGHHARRFYTYWQDEALDFALQESGLTIVERWADETTEWRWLSRLAQK